MDKWQHGNPTAFNELYNNYEPMLLKTAYLITGSKDDAEEVVQNVFLAVWRYRETFDPTKSKLSTWLQRLTVNECSHRRRQNINITSVDNLNLPEITSRQPEEIIVTKIEYERLLRMLEELDEKVKTIFKYRRENM